VVLSGPEVVMDGVINGDLLAVGEEVKINGEVNGSLVAIGKKVVLNGPVTGSVFVSALTLVLGPQANIERDVSYIGGRLDTEETSAINRDLNALTLEAALSGRAGREVNALVGPLNMVQRIQEFMISKGWLPLVPQTDARFFQDGFEKQAAWGMAFGLPSIQNLLLISTASASEPTLNAGPDFQSPAQGSTIDVERLKSWAIPLLRNLVALLLLGLLGVWLVPAQLSWAGEQVRTRPWRALLTGLLVFVLGWFAAVLVFALVLALALFLYWASLPTLGFLAGMLGLMGLGLAVTVFWLSIAYFSKIIVAILVGRLLFKRFIPKYAHSRVWPLVAGVILYALLASVPYLGWIVVVITTFFGLGALWMVSNPRRLPEGQSTAQPQPAGESPEMSVLTEG
jgi:hypothetical protein